MKVGIVIAIQIQTWRRRRKVKTGITRDRESVKSQSPTQLLGRAASQSLSLSRRFFPSLSLYLTHESRSRCTLSTHTHTHLRTGCAQLQATFQLVFKGCGGAGNAIAITAVTATATAATSVTAAAAGEHKKKILQKCVGLLQAGCRYS